MLVIICTEHTWKFEESFDCLQKDVETECKEEDAIDQSAHDFGAVPAVRVMILSDRS